MAKKTSAAKRSRSASFESDAVSSDQPLVLAKKPVLPKKRKIVTPEPSSEDSSGIEIIDPPTPTSVKPPKKHCIKKERIGPLDDPVQIVSKQSGANVRHFGRRLSFGTIDSEDEHLVPPKQADASASSNKEKRIRKPSDKAKAHQSMIDALDALDADAMTETSDFPERISTPLKKQNKTKLNPSVLLTPKESNQSPVKDQQKEGHRSAAKTTSKQKPGTSKSKHPHVSDSEDEPALPKTPSRKKKNSPIKLSEKAKGKLRVITTDSDHAQSDDGKDLKEKQSTPAKWELSDVASEQKETPPPSVEMESTPRTAHAPLTTAEDTANATPSGVVTPASANVNDGIPATETVETFTTLYNFREQKKHLEGDFTVDYTQMEDPEYDLRATFSSICPDVFPKPQGPRSLTHALEFTMLDPFINLSRAPINATDINAQKFLVMKGPGRPHLAVSLLTGLVTACKVVVPGRNSSGSAIKRIGVIPFDTWHEPMVDHLGAKFKRRILYGPVDLHTHITIASRKDGAASATGYASRAETRVPIKLDSKYLSSSSRATPASPAKGASWYQRPFPFPEYLEYEAKVPIYDARALGFAFDKVSFDNLRSLPLYRGPGVKEPDVSDLPPQSVATVAFTINSFTDSKDKAAAVNTNTELGLKLLFNLQFVILLGTVGNPSASPN